jgi:hypothetical protein
MFGEQDEPNVQLQVNNDTTPHDILHRALHGDKTQLQYVLAIAKFSFLRSLLLVTRAAIKECSWIHRDGSSLKAAALTLLAVLHEAVSK